MAFIILLLLLFFWTDFRMTVFFNISIMFLSNIKIYSWQRLWSTYTGEIVTIYVVGKSMTAVLFAGGRMNVINCFYTGGHNITLFLCTLIVRNLDDCWYSFTFYICSVKCTFIKTNKYN